MKIKYYLDQIELRNDMIMLGGWAVDQDGARITYEVREKHSQAPVPCKERRLSRRDVAEAVLHLPEEQMEGKEAVEFGFDLRFPVEPAGVYELCFVTEGGSVKTELSVEKLRKKQEARYLPWKQLVKKTAPGNLKEDGKALAKGGIKGLRRSWERYLVPEARYEAWLSRHLSKKPAPLTEKPLISVIVPLYKTPLPFLQQMVDSVIGQSYENWELCLADGSGDGSLNETLEALAKRDGRIRFSILPENRGISGNTNAALEMARGRYVALLDHDDLLAKHALWELAAAFEGGAQAAYSDEDKVSMDLKRHFEPHFKSDFNLDLLRSNNYICHLFGVEREIALKVGGFRSEYDGSQDYDFILRCIEEAEKVTHIPRILYHWRCHPASTAAVPESKEYCFEAGRRAIEAHLERQGVEGEVSRWEYPGFYHVSYRLQGDPLVSILIPNKDHAETLKICIDSIYEKTKAPRFEIIIIENNSTEPETFAYYEELQKEHDNLRVVTWEGTGFNYSALNNFGAGFARGEYLLLLNNDTQILSDRWLEAMTAICQRPEVGIAGSRLYYSDDTIQHFGVVVGYRMVAEHAFLCMDRNDPGYFMRARLQQNLSVVTAACLLVKKSVFDEVNGLDESFAVAYNDVDFCLRVREKGYLVVTCPEAELYHYESKSRGLEDTPEKLERFRGEQSHLRSKWETLMRQGDPYYNPNLNKVHCDFSINYDEAE